MTDHVEIRKADNFWSALGAHNLGQICVIQQHPGLQWQPHLVRVSCNLGDLRK
jgi:hypothetical protein